MNKSITTILIIIFLAIGGLIAWQVYQQNTSNSSMQPTISPTTMNTPAETMEPSEMNTLTPAISATPIQSENIKVTSPKSNAAITSPVQISGEAKGSWYFEGNFPVRLTDANGKEITNGVAKAKGNWMTENFVPFSATLTFQKPTTDTGTLILEKDNPSGLPQNAEKIEIPVKF